MPLYEYECRQCGVHFERRQSVHDEPVSDCPECGGAVHRVLFPVGIIFKGSGFYITDSRRPQPIGDNNNGNKFKDNGSSKSETSGSSDSKTSSSAEPVGSST